MAYDLVVHSLETGEERVYSRDGIRPGPPRWFHDGGGFLTLVQNKSRTRSLYRVETKTGEFKEVLEFDPSELAPGLFALSSDDKTLYLGSRDSKESQTIDRIIAIDVASGQRRQIFALPGTSGLDFQLSPDGRMFAIRSTDPKTNETRFGVTAVDGANYREIYAAPAAEVARDILAWAPDSRAILFGKPDPGKPDAQVLNFRRNRQIMRIPVEGGRPEFTGWSVKSSVRGILPCSDGSRIVLSSTEFTSELWALDNVLSVLK